MSADPTLCIAKKVRPSFVQDQHGQNQAGDEIQKHALEREQQPGTESRTLAVGREGIEWCNVLHSVWCGWGGGRNQTILGTFSSL